MKQLGRRSTDPELGAFIGFNSSSDSEMSHDEVNVRQKMAKRDMLEFIFLGVAG